jgi:methanogenic corrinoid protein MtbC1
MKAAAEILEAEILRSGTKRSKVGKVVLGTVQGDLHDIGKTIVAAILSSHGFDVVDLRVNIPADDFIEAVKRERPDVLGMSSLLTVTVKELEKSDFCSKRKRNAAGCLSYYGWRGGHRCLC